MSDSARPHRRQPTRLPRLWASPGKNTGVGCHFLLQCMQVKSESEVAQLCPTLSDPMDCSPPGSIHGIFRATVLEWGAIAFSRSWHIEGIKYNIYFWTARRSNQSILKEVNSEYSLKGLMLKLKLQYFGHLMQRVDSLKKDPDAGRV